MAPYAPHVSLHGYAWLQVPRTAVLPLRPTLISEQSGDDYDSSLPDKPSLISRSGRYALHSTILFVQHAIDLHNVA